MTPANLQALQFILTFIELMVADRIELEPCAVHGLDRAFIVKQRGDQGCRANQITGRDDSCGRIQSFKLRDHASDLVDAASRSYHCGIAATCRGDGEISGRLHLPMEIVQAEQFDCDVGIDGDGVCVTDCTRERHVQPQLTKFHCEFLF